MEKGDMWVKVIVDNRSKILEIFIDTKGTIKYTELKLNVINRLNTTDGKERILAIFDEEYAKIK